jgi:hypothetical protein
MQVFLRKWLVLIASGAFVMQAAGGCPVNLDPGQAAISSALSTGTQTLINSILGLYVRAGVNQALHL